MLNTPFTPKNPNGTLRVILLGRLSRPKETVEQTQATIEASYRYAREFIERVHDGPVEYRELGEQISGLVGDRRTISEARQLMETGEWDVVLTEDLSRIYRNPQMQYAFVHECVDLQVRLICIADGLDTADENWEVMLGAASLRHCLHIPDTRRRIKRSAKHSFHKGGMVQRVRFGYRKFNAEQAASGEFGPVGVRMARLAEWQELFDEIRQALLAGRSPSAIADELNRRKVPVGPSATRGFWHFALLKNLLRDPILHGLRAFRRVIYVPLLKDGGYRREVNPTPETEYVPELAFMTKEQQEEMLQAVGWSIKWHSTEVDASKAIRCRSRALWPQLAAKCAICGSHMVVMGTFVKCAKAIKAGGASCWNHVQAPLACIRERTVTWLSGELRRHPEAFGALLDAALEVIARHDADRGDEAKRLGREEEQLRKQLANLGDAIKNGAENSSTLINMLTSTEAQLQEVQQRRAAKASDSPELPGTRAQLKANFEPVLRSLVETSVEFAEVLREFFPRFDIQPVQALDTGQVRPRAILHFGANATAGNEMDNPPRVVTFDLFEPPVHIRMGPLVTQIRQSSPKATMKEIGERVGTSHASVKRAVDYCARMAKAGVIDPYVPLTTKPAEASRWRHAM